MIITIIIPAYNAERYIDRCFASIFKDSPAEELFEVIAINDGSKDNTLNLLKEYGEQYSNVVVLDQHNSGVSVARNAGINAAKGDYVLFLDVDDELIGGALAKVCDYLMNHDQMDMLVTRQVRKNSKKEWLVEEPTLEEQVTYDGVCAFKKHFIRTNAGGGICNTSFIRDHHLSFPSGVKNAEDTVFFGHLQVYANSIVYYNLPLYRINEMEDSASRIANHTNMGNNLLVTMRSVIEVKQSLSVDKERLAIFDYVVYQLLANTIAEFVASKELSYRQFRREVDVQSILPLETHSMHIMKGKARLMNFSISLYYFLSWIKHCLDK